MKKLKYLLTFLIAICVLPNIVSATETIYFKPYNIGNEITVTLDEAGNIKKQFIVIEATPEGEQRNVEKFEKGNENYEYVTAVLKDSLMDSKFTSGNTVTYERSLARSNLVIKTTDAGWINYEEIRLLTIDDLFNC